METETQEEREALKQVRTAHRICAAYYQRILPLIERATEELDLKYESWRNWAFSFPSRRSSPFQKFEWDQLPMLNPRFTFTGSTGSEPSTGYLVTVLLVTDSLVTHETKHAQPQGPRGPDAAQVGTRGDSGESRIDVFVFYPAEPIPEERVTSIRPERGNENPDHLLESGAVEAWDEGRYRVAAGSIPIERLMDDSGPDTLANHIDETRDRARQGIGLGA